MKKYIISAAAVSAMFLTGLLLLAGKQPAPVADFYLTQGVAIGGYDAVAYFTDHKAVKGNSAISYTWQGGQWYFATEAHRKLFETQPQKYAPQYGGWCAYGASKGYKAATQPEAWTIVGEKLYLNYNPEVKKVWLQDTAARIQKANTYWASLGSANQ